MNNDNSSKLLIHEKQEKGVIFNPPIKNQSKERNSKPKFELNLSDYFKLIQHKKVPNIFIKKSNNNNSPSKKADKNKSHIKSNQTSHSSSKSKTKKPQEKKTKKISKNDCEKKENKNDDNKLKDFEIKHLNKSDSEKIFNKRLNKQKSAKIKLPSTNNTTIKKTTIKKLIRNASCKNFNNSKIKKDYDLIDINIKKSENEEMDDHDIGKYLISSKYFEKVKYNKCQYYNDKNIYYIETRRQRIEDYFNKIIYEKYKALKPLRMTQRIFYKEENYNINNQQNEINVANNLFYSDYNRKNNYFKSINKFIFEESLNYNKYDKNISNNKNLKLYYKNVKQISSSRKNLLTNDFFGRKEYSLLDFDFSFLCKKHKTRKNK